MISTVSRFFFFKTYSITFGYEVYECYILTNKYKWDSVRNKYIYLPTDWRLRVPAAVYRFRSRTDFRKAIAVG